MSKQFLQLARPLCVVLALVVMASCSLTGDDPAEDEGVLIDGEPQQSHDDTNDVLYSSWANFVAANWQQVTEFSRITQLYEVDEARITQAFMSTGLVLVYVKFAGSSSPREKS